MPFLKLIKTKNPLPRRVTIALPASPPKKVPYRLITKVHPPNMKIRFVPKDPEVHDV
jgi:hypothetical protein